MSQENLKKDSEKYSVPEIHRNESKLLISFYNTLEKVKIIEMPHEFNQNPIRPAIMRILRNGIEDHDLKQRRFALNAREIKELLEKDEKLIQIFQKKVVKGKTAKIISYTNLYFHLSKLEEVGAIKKVAYVIERSHKIAYYSPTAYLILHCDPSYELNKLSEIFKELGIFMSSITSDVDIDMIQKLPYHLHKLTNQHDKQLALFLAEYEEIIMNKQLDLRKLFSALKMIDSISLEYITLMKDINNIIVKLMKIK